MLSSSSSPDIEERDSPDMDEDSDKKVDNAEEAVEKVLVYWSVLCTYNLGCVTQDTF